MGRSVLALALLGTTSSGLTTPGATRRDFLTLSSGAAFTAVGPAQAVDEEPDALMTAVELGSLGTSRPYLVTSGKELVAIPARDAVGMLTDVQTIWLGEHHDAMEDSREIQAGIIAAVAVAKAAKRPRPCIGVGLEAVRAEYQDCLDAYIATGKPGDLGSLREATNWDAHWPYPLESYAAVLEMCRELQLPLLALGASSPEIDTVEQKGLSALDPDAWQRLSLPEGATTLATTSDDLTIASSDNAFANHYCSRLVWDESMAARAAAWVDARRDFDPTLVVLAGAEHVAFGCGAPARCARRLSQFRDPARSVLLNPRQDDFRLNAQAGGSLGIRFASTAAPDTSALPSDDLPLADLVWFSPWTDQMI